MDRRSKRPGNLPDTYGPWNDKPYEFDTSAAAPRRVNSIDQCKATAEQLFLEPRCLATLDYQTITETGMDNTVSWTVDQASQGHGILLWFDSVLAEGVTLTNRPGAPRLIYGRHFCPGLTPLDVNPATR